MSFHVSTVPEDPIPEARRTSMRKREESTEERSMTEDALQVLWSGK